MAINAHFSLNYKPKISSNKNLFKKSVLAKNRKNPNSFLPVLEVSFYFAKMAMDMAEQTDITETGDIPIFSINEIDMTEFGYQRKDLEKFCSEQIRIPPKLPNILKQVNYCVFNKIGKCIILISILLTVHQGGDEDSAP